MKLLSIKAASIASGIGYPTLKRLVRERKLVVAYLPGRVRPLVDMDDVVKLVEASKAGSTDGSSEEIRSLPIVDFKAPKASSQSPRLTAKQRPELPYYERFRSRLNG